MDLSLATTSKRFSFSVETNTIQCWNQHDKREIPTATQHYELLNQHTHLLSLSHKLNEFNTEHNCISVRELIKLPLVAAMNSLCTTVHT